MRPHLYTRPCPLVRRSVGPSVGRLVMLSSKSLKNGLLRILNDTDGAGREKKRDEEEEGTRRVKNEKVVNKNENEKVPKGRIVDHSVLSCQNTVNYGGCYDLIY